MAIGIVEDTVVHLNVSCLVLRKDQVTRKHCTVETEKVDWIRFNRIRRQWPYLIT